MRLEQFHPVYRAITWQPGVYPRGRFRTQFWNPLRTSYVNILMRVLLAFSLVMSVVGAGIAQGPCKSTVVGDLRIEQFHSRIFDRMMTVRVWLPPNYNDATEVPRKFATLYMLDGQNAFDQCTAFKGEQELRIDETVTRLIAEHSIAPMIVVGIDSAHGEGRDYEYEVWKDPLTDGNQKEPDGKQLPSFFASELMPFVSKRYRVSDDPAHIGIGGTSVGAFAALYVALNRPDLFGLVLAESPDLWLGNGQLLRDTTLLLRAPDRVAIGVGSTEYNFPQSEGYFGPLRITEQDADAATLKMDRILASNLEQAFIKHSAVQFVIEPGANHSAVYWSGRIPAAISFLFADAGRVH
jgi:enterochelin esterase-like enzyme